jgi:nicotinamidase-related amidase
MPNFQEQLKKVFSFFKPENLEVQKIKYEGDVALLVIDVQKEFCDPKRFFGRGNAETAEVSKRIQSLVPEFRKAGIPVYAVYFSREEKKNAADIDFYEFTPHPDDTLVAKNQDSAFEGSNIKKILLEDKRKTLLTCGFNLNACVKSTVLDALIEGFDVCLLRDLVGNDNENDCSPAEGHLADMRDMGVMIEKSDTILARLRDRKNAPPKP